jgi:uncharacterized protein YutE (UPF0331/DUF86 family)
MRTGPGIVWQRSGLVDAESVTRRLRYMGEHIAKLRDIEKRGHAAFEEDEMLRLASERALQLAIQSATDIANHVLAEDTDITPEDYGDAFRALAPLGVIDPSLAERLASAAGLRNILVHVYLDLDRARVWEAIENIEDLVKFAAAIDHYMTQATDSS